MQFFILTLLTLSLYATPTFTKERLYTLQDGTTFSARLQGDAFLHYYIAQDGAIILFNKKEARFEYAAVKNDTLIPSGIAYHPKKRRGAAVDKALLKRLWIQKHKRR